MAELGPVRGQCAALADSGAAVRHP